MDVSPAPTDEEATAIAVAIALAWPHAVVAPAPQQPNRWRFAGRWWTKPIPIRRERPW